MCVGGVQDTFGASLPLPSLGWQAGTTPITQSWFQESSVWLWVHARSGVTVSDQCTEAPLPSSQDLGEACMMGTVKKLWC